MKNGGFTLLEIMVALGILGVGLMILLESHYTSLNVQDLMDDEVLGRQMIESAIAKAEVGVLQGELDGGDEFGPRYPEFTWTYSAARVGEQDEVELYQVTVTILGGEDDKSLTFFVYDTSAANTKTKGTIFKDTARPKGE